MFETNIVVIHNQIPQKISLTELPLPRSRHDSFPRRHRDALCVVLSHYNTQQRAPREKLFLRKIFEFSLHKTTFLLRRNPQRRRRKHAAEYLKG
jgi:hypothetical protein|tara:strand:- start:183 stop:464 length:282 start_codon:yes stop_codon:yes gene_type:complete